MKAALRLAHKAAEEGEVPVGAVVVCDGKIVGRGRNRRETKKNALHHAEIEAINKACKKLGGWRLHRCDLYVTLEPCPMCAGAIINARIKTVYYGATDPKAGSCGSLINLFELPYNHQPAMVSGVLGEQCAEVLKSFFRTLREKRKCSACNRNQTPWRRLTIESKRNKGLKQCKEKSLARALASSCFPQAVRSAWATSGSSHGWWDSTAAARSLSFMCCF